VVETKTSADTKWFPEKRSTLRRTVPFLLVGLLIFIGYLYFFVDIPEMLTTIQHINLFYYSLAVAVLLLNMVAYSLTWQYFLRPLSINVPFKKTFLITWVGIFVEFFVPSESIGEDASKIYLMTKESGENTGKVVASVLGHRILSMVVTLSTLIICSLSLFITKYELNALVLNLTLLIIVGTAIPLIFIFLLFLKKDLTQKLVDLLLRFFTFVSRGRLKLASLRSKARKALSAFHQSIEVLGRNPRSLVQPVFFSIVCYFLSILISYLVFFSLGYPVSFVLLTIVYSISRSLQSIPTMLPGEVGFIEIVMTTLYIALLGPQADAVSAAATVLIRVLWVWFRLPLGFIAVHWIVSRGLV
jgi:uncharacterized protein (TIRG00374 family)